MDTQDQNKKYYCARCFHVVSNDEKVDIEGQYFHRICSMCCVCRKVPTSLKSFYGHVFCCDCFKTHVLSQFHKANPWWLQPKSSNESHPNSDEKPAAKDNARKESDAKKSICARCLEVVPNNPVQIDSQNFHKDCARCYCCQTVPTALKIYYGQVFCEDCFHRHILNRNKDNEDEFFKCCHEHWCPSFFSHMKDFMSSKDSPSPYIFMMQDPSSPFCKCGAGKQKWSDSEEPKKSAAGILHENNSIATWDMSFETNTEASEDTDVTKVDESANLDEIIDVAQKIEKLTKLLQENVVHEKNKKKWQNFVEPHTTLKVFGEPSMYGWINIQDIIKNKNQKETSQCPQCLWQRGVIFENRKVFSNVLCAGENCCLK